jgi:hypothetical protein
MVMALESPLEYFKLDCICQKKNKMLSQTNRKTKQHSTIALDQNFATHMFM